jgi:hypothetical protein
MAYSVARPCVLTVVVLSHRAKRRRLSTNRPWIADAPAAGFNERDEGLDHFVEQCGLFEIGRVAGFREEGQPGGGQMVFQKQAGLDAGIVLVAAGTRRALPIRHVRSAKPQPPTT